MSETPCTPPPYVGDVLRLRNAGGAGPGFSDLTLQVGNPVIYDAEGRRLDGEHYVRGMAFLLEDQQCNCVDIVLGSEQIVALIEALTTYVATCESTVSLSGPRMIEHLT